MYEITNSIFEHNNIIEKLIDKIPTIIKIAESIIVTIQNGGKVVIFGCGGSAADSQHIVGELVGKFKFERRALPAIALTTNTSVITAISNDIDFEKVFSRQVKALVKKEDLVIGISTSGNSKSVWSGLYAAWNIGAKTVALTGGDGGVLTFMGGNHIVLIVPSYNTPRIQEAHILIGHIICEIVEKAFVDA